MRGRFLGLLDDPGFAAAMAPFDECEECAHQCAYRRRAESVVHADPDAAARLVELASAGSWKAAAAALPAPGSDHDEDYRMCVFVHAVRTTAVSEPVRMVRQMRRHLRESPVP